jgi:hypothetical protein
MNLTFSALAATLLLAQTPDAPLTTQPGGKAYTYSNGVLVPFSDAQRPAFFDRGPSETNNRPILSKIRGWFNRNNRNSNEAAPLPPVISTEPLPRPFGTPATPLAPAPAPSAAPGEFPKKLPITPQNFTPKNEVQVLPQKPAEAPKAAPATTPPAKNDTKAAPKTDSVSTVSLRQVPSTARSPILPANVHRIGRDDKFAWVTGQLEVEKGQFVLYYATPETVDQYHGRIVLNSQNVDMRQFRSGDLVSAQGQIHSSRGSAMYNITSADLIERPKR